MSKHHGIMAASLERSAERVEAERQTVAELDGWRAQALPDTSAPLDAEALARLVVSCLSTLGIDVADFSVNTVHYYRRKDILDAPVGRTSAARYDVRHVWQAAGARLAGHLGLVTLAEARSIMRGADERTLVEFVAARVVDARARVHLRKATAVRARPLPGAHPAPAPRALFVDGSVPSSGSHRGAVPAVMIPLSGDAWCVLPTSHPAHHSPAAALQLVRDLVGALRLPLGGVTIHEREEANA
jgi:hypothetical protein